MAKHKDRKGYLKSMVRGTGVSKQYLDYADYNPKDVHEGSATYGRSTYTDSPSTMKSQYSMAVRRGHGKTAFKFQGKLYRITNAKGTAYEEVQV